MTETLDELLISFEKKLSTINDDFDTLQKTVKNLTEKVKDERKNNENMIEQFKKYDVVESDIIKLNVGGSFFSSLKSTLIKQIKNADDELYSPNMFEALLNGFVKPKYDEKKAIFIDRNPKNFGYILDYLRMANTECEFELAPDVDKVEVKKEAKFYNIQGLVDKIDKTKAPLSNQKVLLDSNILDKLKSNELIDLCGFSKTSSWRLIYRATRDGFGATNFHQKCDYIPKTLVLVKSHNGSIFGGYTEQTWDGSGFKSDKNSFIFSYDKRLKLPIYPGSEGSSINCNPSYGPTFGGGHDFHIASNSNSSNSSYSNFSYSYKHNAYTNGSTQAQSFLAGSSNFLTTEIEVYAQN